MKKVLHVVACLELGGTETFIMNNYRAMAKSDVHFDFFVFEKKDYPYADEIRALGGNIFFGCHPSVRHFISFCKTLMGVIRENGYDAVHAHVNSGNAFAMLVAKLCNVKLRISHSHATTLPQGSVLKKLVFNIRRLMIRLFSTHFLSCSNEAGAVLYGARFFEKRGTLINNGIDIDRFVDCTPSDALRQEFSLTTDSLVLGNITRFDKIKNQSFILDVFCEILKREDNATLILGGVDGGELESVKDRAKTLGISDNVRFIGKRTDVANCLKLIDIYLFPSVYEGLGFALIEAQAAGCDCFASDAVPRASDMGIGSAEYYPLSSGAENWATRILEKHSAFVRPDAESIKKAFEKNRYTIETSARLLLDIYDLR